MLIVMCRVGVSAEIVAQEGAWCWFADPRALHYSSPDGDIDMTYIGYIDVHGNIKAMQYDHLRQQSTEVLVRSCFQPDDHDNPTFLVLPDQRVMVFYSRHTDEACIYYRVSAAKGDITTLGAEHRLETTHNTTYPSPFILSDDPEHIYLCWRGIKWHPTIAQLSIPDKADNAEFTWGPKQMVQSTGARPYAKYCSNGKDKIYVAYTTGHPDNENPNFLYLSYFDVNTRNLCAIDGEIQSSVDVQPFAVNKTQEFVAAHPLTVIDSSPYRDWVWQLTLDANEYPVVAMTRISPDKKSHNYYCARYDGQQWRLNLIAHAGGHFHQSPDIEHCYTAGMAIDGSDSHLIYCSVPVTGQYGRVYEIVAYRLDDNGEIVSAEPVTANSQHNNVRPYCIADSQDSPLQMAWMNGDYYDWIVSERHPEAYCTSIVTDFDGYGTATPELPEATLPYKFQKSEDFVLSLTLNPADVDKKGNLLSLGDLSYRVDPDELLPEIKIGKKTYKSSNRLGTSDGWLQRPRGTDGVWHKPDPFESFDLRIEYANGVLTSYINGRVDQTINVLQ